MFGAQRHPISGRILFPHCFNCDELGYSHPGPCDYLRAPRGIDMQDPPTREAVREMHRASEDARQPFLDRLALWTQHAAVAGRSLGERLRWSRWADAARSVAPVR